MMLEYVVFVFFFSSRRRHTRCLSDWSSDVCSSDLIGAPPPGGGPPPGPPGPPGPPVQIGRASCRERVSVTVAEETVNKEDIEECKTGAEVEEVTEVRMNGAENNTDGESDNNDRHNT